MTIMKDKPRDDQDELEYTQGQNLDKGKDFSFFELDFGHSQKRDVGHYDGDDVEIEYSSETYREPDPDYSKLSDVLPNFERNFERFELERDKLKDRYTHAWNQGDLVSYFALEAKYQELSGFIKGLKVLKDVLRHWEEYEWGEMDISSSYISEDVLNPTHRQNAQRKFDTIISRALQVLGSHKERDKDPS